MTASTPTPWHASQKSVYVSDINHNCIAQMLRGKNENAANAALIVSAVNNHDRVVAALKECASRCRYDGDLFHDQGLESRRDASWRAAGLAEAALKAVEASAVIDDRSAPDAMEVAR